MSTQFSVARVTHPHIFVTPNLHRSTTVRTLKIFRNRPNKLPNAWTSFEVSSNQDLFAALMAMRTHNHIYLNFCLVRISLQIHLLFEQTCRAGIFCKKGAGVRSEPTNPQDHPTLHEKTTNIPSRYTLLTQPINTPTNLNLMLRCLKTQSPTAFKTRPKNRTHPKNQPSPLTLPPR